MPTTNYTHECRETVLWANAQLITPEDLNNAQRLQERRALDFLMRGMFMEAGDFDTVAAFNPWLRPIGRALSMEQNNPTGLSVIVRKGSIMWRSGVDPGTPEPHWLLHHMDSDVTVTVDAADATNPRVDLLSAKIEYDPLDTGSVDGGLRASKDAAGNVVSQLLDTRRRTLLTVTYTPGTPAASPVAPATPAGHVKIGDIQVAALATTLATSTVADYRTPAGMTRYSVLGTAALNSSTFANTSLTSTDFRASAASQTARYHVNPAACHYVEPPRSISVFREVFPPRHMRLRRIAVNCNVTGAGTIALQTNNAAVIQAISTTVDAQNWTFLEPTLPVWIDLRAWPTNGGNPLNWLANASGHPGGGGGLLVIVTSGASGDQVNAVMADFWGV